MDKKLMKAIREGNTHYFYTCRTWRRKRQSILDRDNNECQMCKKKGNVTVGTKADPLIVHHRKELKYFPELGLTDTNLIAICNDCHENVCHPDRLEGYKEKKKVFENEERW